MRHVVRANLRAGADWIKLAVTGGLVSEHDQPLIAELTPEEIAVAVFEAARKGKHVAVHAYGGEGLTNAVAGRRSLGRARRLPHRGAGRGDGRARLLPRADALGDARLPALGGAGRAHADRCEKILDFGLDIGACVRMAKEYGVKLASGTDYIQREQHGRNLEEVLLMHRAGLTVEEALLVATAGGAELCGVDDELGRLEEGYLFDAIVLDGDPGDLSGSPSRAP